MLSTTVPADVASAVHTPAVSTVPAAPPAVDAGSTNTAAARYTAQPGTHPVLSSFNDASPVDVTPMVPTGVSSTGTGSSATPAQAEPGANSTNAVGGDALNVPPGPLACMSTTTTRIASDPGASEPDHAASRVVGTEPGTVPPPLAVYQWPTNPNPGCRAERSSPSEMTGVASYGAGEVPSQAKMTTATPSPDETSPGAKPNRLTDVCVETVVTSETQPTGTPKRNALSLAVP